jgi:hypothetical protein
VSLALLEELERAYGRLLPTLEAVPRDGADTLAADWEACCRAFERLRGAPPGTADEQWQAALVRVHRLHALVSSLAGRAHDAVGGEIERLAALRARLPAAGKPRTGQACDVRG